MHRFDPNHDVASVRSLAYYGSPLVWQVVPRRETGGRALGRAWLQPDGSGGWRPKRGRAPEGFLTEAQAASQMLELAKEHHADQLLLEKDAEERRRRGVLFRELAHEWHAYLEHEKGARPSTLRDYRWVLAEPGQPHRRGRGQSPGLLMAALGDRPAREVTTREVAEHLRALDRAGATPRSVNKQRQVISAIYGYAMREDTYMLPINPATGTNKRREPPPKVLDFYEPEEIERSHVPPSTERTASSPTR